MKQLKTKYVTYTLVALLTVQIHATQEPPKNSWIKYVLSNPRRVIQGISGTVAAGSFIWGLYHYHQRNSEDHKVLQETRSFVEANIQKQTDEDGLVKNLFFDGSNPESIYNPERILFSRDCATYADPTGKNLYYTRWLQMTKDETLLSQYSAPTRDFIKCQNPHGLILHSVSALMSRNKPHETKTKIGFQCGIAATTLGIIATCCP